MVPPIGNPIVFRSLNGNSPFWNVTFSGAVDEYVGYDLDEVAPVIEKTLRATREGSGHAGKGLRKVSEDLVQDI
jgi:hypothetical protein